jgi:hypothetical protein
MYTATRLLFENWIEWLAIITIQESWTLYDWDDAVRIFARTWLQGFHVFRDEALSDPDQLYGKDIE